MEPSATDEEAEEDSAPVGPGADEEAAFLAGDGADPMVAGMIEPPVSTAEEESTNGLPALEELVKRIPAEVLGTMDELFRAKFATVQRVPKKSLKG